MVSKVFGSRKPVGRLASGPGGVGGEVFDLRKDVEAAFADLQANGVAVFKSNGAVMIGAVDADGILTTTSSSASPVTLTGTNFNGVLAPSTGDAIIKSPKRVTITVSGAGTPANWTGGSIVITGTDADGAALSETVSSAAGAGTTTSTEYFATVASIAIPAQGGTGASYTIGVAADTASIASITGATSAQTLRTPAQFNRDRVGNRPFAPGRLLAVVLNNHADWDSSTMTIRGLDPQGLPISEDFTIPNGGNTTVNGTKVFSQVLEIDVPACSGTSATAQVGYQDTIIGLYVPVEAGGDAVVIKELSRADSAGSWSAPTAGAVSAAAAPYGTYTPHSSAQPDGAREYLLTYISK